ncbi:MAG TPA: hypothetical protein VGM41_09145, partial [Chitinophagaceae bacterium]
MDQTGKYGGNGTTRRQFIKLAGVAGMGIPFASLGDFSGEAIAIVSDPEDALAASAPAVWAARELEQALASKGIVVSRYDKPGDAKTAALIIIAAGAGSATANTLLKTPGISIPAIPEALALVPVKQEGRQLLLACGEDPRGLVYALLELADCVRYSENPFKTLQARQPVVEQPANSIRSLTRLFVSDTEDKPWYNDREMWPQYLSMLATQRFNRFSLAFGIGYDFLQKVTDAYFLFAYPFLLSVPGYHVRVPQLPDAERDSNLAMLRFISEQTVARGLQFQLGLWMHGYEWLNTTNANYTIEGITKENHAAYCRDAVRLLLQTCPAISGITFRVHGESGVTEGSYQFWATIFDGIKTCGRKVEIDMHAKGLDQEMINAALATGMPVVLSPKYWAEHMGMPYHQADIRALEIPNSNQKASGLMNLSTGSRSFLRYGYGDLLREDRPYKVLYRVWPGTQRLLLWGDPLTAAAHSRAFSFCGGDGVEWMEPLSFKGRRGSGIAGDRCGYADATYRPRWDWEKYLYTIRVFGRMAYNPHTPADTWQRFLRSETGAGANAMEAALANASRILPLVLTAHAASAANNNYWPEMYSNQPITDPNLKNTYSDTPSPKTFGNVSPLDPQLFLSINDFVKECLDGKRSGKYSPLELAQWLEEYAAEGAKHLAEAKAQSGGNKKAGWRRMVTDVSMQVGLGYFFAAKFRAGVLYAIYEQSGDRNALEEALKTYRKARQYWEGVATAGKNIYKTDITVGEQSWLRGHWLDRLSAMDDDIDNMAKKLEEHKEGPAQIDDRAKNMVEQALGRPERSVVSCGHTPPKTFSKGETVELEFTFDRDPQSAILYYRHVNHAERYQQTALVLQGNKGSAAIPAGYTNTPYPLAYYLE